MKISEKTVEEFLKQALIKNWQPWTSKLILEVQKIFREYFKIQKNDYLENLKWEMDLTVNLFKVETWNNTEKARKILEEKYISVITAVTMKGSLNFLKNLDISSDFWIQDLIAIEYAKKKAGELITQVDETTKTQINKIITDWIKTWADYSSIAKLIKKRFASFSKNRATLIATNEIWNAYEYWKNEQAKEYSSRTWNQMMKKSISQGDSRVSSICRECASQGWIKNEELFASGFEHSPHHIACRCYIKYKTINNI